MSEDVLDIVRTQSLVSAIAREIEAGILRGDFAPGERLNEIHLARRFQTSRGPVREACRGLEQAGLLDSRRNHGVFVRQISDAEAFEVYDLRSVLFGLAGELLAVRINDAVLAELQDLHDRMAHAVMIGNAESYFPANLAFHGRIVDSCGNETLKEQYHGLVKKLRLCRARNLHKRESLMASIAEHADILGALRSRSPEQAFATHRVHVRNARNRFTALAAGIVTEPA